VVLVVKRNNNEKSNQKLANRQLSTNRVDHLHNDGVRFNVWRIVAN
jgi:hypothetical protein